jgi:CHAD domain-containing protein
MVPTHAEKAFRKLRKTVQCFSVKPSIEQVHDLRNQARRFEAIAGILALDRDAKCARLLKSIKAIRKAAGAVRDMDVLSQDALFLSHESEQRGWDKTPVLRLLHHLHFQRIHCARKLTSTLKKRGHLIETSLKQSSHILKKRLASSSANEEARRDILRNEDAAVMQSMLSLRLWPELDSENLHSFRLAVKHLRILMQMAGGAEAQMTADLGKTKDLIGHWHDWLELETIAERILTADEDQRVLRRIHEITAGKFKVAVHNAEALLNKHIRFQASKAA